MDEQVGPLIAVGLGGVGSNLLVDEQARLAPLSAESATALIAASRAGSALQQAQVGTGTLVDAIVRVGQLAADHHQLIEVDLNPIITTNAMCAVTDAVIRVAAGRSTPARRRL